MSTATKTKLPTLDELRERAAKLGIDISHLGRKKKEIKALLDAESAKVAALAMKSLTTGHLDYQGALNAEKKKKTPTIRRKKASTPKVSPDNPWSDFFGKSPKPKKKKEFGPSKYFGGTPRKTTEARKKEEADIDAFLKEKASKHPVPKGMTRVVKPDGYDPNNPKPRRNGLVGPRTMVCGHPEWWWDKGLGRCTKCLPKNRFLGRKK